MPQQTNGSRPVIVPPVLLARLRAAGITKPEAGDRLSVAQMDQLLASQPDAGDRIYCKNAAAQAGILPPEYRG